MDGASKKEKRFMDIDICGCGVWYNGDKWYWKKCNKNLQTINVKRKETLRRKSNLKIKGI